MDQELIHINRVLKGDKVAFSYLVNTYEDMVYSLAFRMLRNETDAEDLAQEVFIEVYRSLAQFRGKSKFSTWIYRITYNKAITLLRKNRPEISSDSEVFLEKKGGSDNLEHGLSRDEETIASLQTALKYLTEDEQVMIMLHYYEGQTIEDIASVMQISPSNVKIKLFRARKKLKEKIENMNVELAF